MSDYHVNEAAFELPERPFADKTIHGLDATLAEGKTLGVLVHRRPLEAGKTLHALVDDNIALNVKRLSGFTVLGRADAALGGLPCVDVRTQWRTPRTPYYQRQAHVIFKDSLMIFAVSAPVDEQAVCDETFETLLATLAWRTG